jgi:hypothetical protein
MITEKIVIRIPNQRKIPAKFMGDLDKGHRTQASVNTKDATSDDLSKALTIPPSLEIKPGALSNAILARAANARALTSDCVV